ncbi:hypothetical protein ACNQ0T_24465, partial [Enterobacter cloacae complex sp.6700776]|uniref:hypothetical protein n=1 Tax=Enterobacter cloacae complex sp.6700776 TaxID=3397179 RepID=UPI003AACCE17
EVPGLVGSEMCIRDRMQQSDIQHMEFRDDRFVAAVQTTRVNHIRHLVQFTEHPCLLYTSDAADDIAPV